MKSWDKFSWGNVQSDKVYAFSSGKVLRRDQFTEDMVYVRNGVIIPAPDINTEVITIDLGKDTILAPGFIDVQINGAFGIDLTSSLGGDSSGLRQIASKLVQYGVTSFCPTIVSTTTDNYMKILKNIQIFDGSNEGAGCLGAHLEGPFISLFHKGAHDPECIFDFPKGIQDVDSMYGKDLKNVAIVTLAPEKENAMSVIRYLRENNIVVSIALILVSDGIAALGLGDGKHNLGSQTIKITGTKAVIDGTDTLSGSVTPLDQCVRNYAKVTGCPQAQALAAATHRPAQLLHLDSSKGSIVHGACADFVVLDDGLNVLSTWIHGRLVYNGRTKCGL